MRNFLFCLLMVGAMAKTTYGDIKIVPVGYSAGGQALAGWLAYDDSVKEKRPGVVVYPEWWGMTDYPRSRAKQLAELGYVAFAADMYGDGKSTDDPKEAGAWAGAVKGDDKVLVDRAKAAMDLLKKDSRVDGSQIGAIGYCFGGTVALELARSGADFQGLVSFHGGLETDNPAEAGKFKPKVLICTGGLDSFVPAKQVMAFEEEMTNAGADWQVITYGGAHHAFTNPAADSHGIANIAYNASADKRSFEAMTAFFKELFGK
jgi:dienelactone hydrolase